MRRGGALYVFGARDCGCSFGSLAQRVRRCSCLDSNPVRPPRGVTSTERYSRTRSQKVVGQADPQHMYQLIYNHSGISLDDITIQLNAGLVTSITTTTTDQTVQIVQGVTSLLSQVSATQAAIAKAAKPLVAPLETPQCADMQVNLRQEHYTRRWRNLCYAAGHNRMHDPVHGSSNSCLALAPWSAWLRCSR
jgi:hypothetical protein